MLGAVLMLALASSSTCSWDHPGANPYRHSGQSVVAALHDYRLPAATEQALQRKMETLTYDDIVEIKKDSIVGKKATYGNLHGMHSEHGHYCAGATVMTHWAPEHVERGLVYCEGEICVVVPTICNNVALLDRKPDEFNIEPAAGPTMIASSVTPPALDSSPPDMLFGEDLPIASTTPDDLPSSTFPDHFSGGYFPFDAPPDGGLLQPPSGGPPVIVPPPVVIPPVRAIPEPSSWILWGLGVIVLGRFYLRHVKASKPPERRSRVSRFGGLRRYE